MIQACLNGNNINLERSLICYLISDSYFFFLVENSFQEEKCHQVIEEMRQCCIKWKTSVSLCCEGIDLEKEYKTITKVPKTENQKK